MECTIHDRGRGPEIAGSRITVYDVLAETEAGTSSEQMASWWHLDVAQIHLALRYIEEHKEEVQRQWAAIKDRNARGNPPHIRKLMDENFAKHAPLFEAMKERARQRREANENAGPAGGH